MSPAVSVEVDSLIPGSSLSVAEPRAGHGEFKTIDTVEIQAVCECVFVCTYTSADMSAFEWLQWEETEIDKMIIGLFHTEETG